MDRLAQAAGIRFSEVFAHIVQGIHGVFTQVKLALSHHPSISVVALIADLSRAACMINLNLEQTPRELVDQFRRPDEIGKPNRGSRPIPSNNGTWDARPRAPRGGFGPPPSTSTYPGRSIELSHGRTPRRASYAPTRAEPEQTPVAPPECWGCGQLGHFHRECPRGQLRRENYTTQAHQIASSSKYMKECVVNGRFRVMGLMDTGCSAVLIRASRAEELDLVLAREIIPIFGTGDVSAPATHTIGKVVFDSFQVRRPLRVSRLWLFQTMLSRRISVLGEPSSTCPIWHPCASTMSSSSGREIPPFGGSVMLDPNVHVRPSS